jgi:hypothetical protein
MAGRTKRNRRRPIARTAAPAATPSEPVLEPGVDVDVDAAVAPLLGRRDLIEALGVALAAAALFFTTFSNHVALGDAPESVAGAKTIGVLHAPGYPSYVAVAHAFGAIVAVGGWAARVNLFSLVCAAFMVGAVYLLARGFGAGRPGAALGAFALATSASFWFNADFAKHYPFSGLLVTLAALAVVHWQNGGRPAWLVVAGALLGLAAGASWELAAIMTAGLAVLVGFGVRRAGLGLIAGAASALAAVAVGAYLFLLWRASRHPAVNWGEVNDLHRLVGQVTQRDFRGQDVNVVQRSAIAKVAIRVPVYVGIVVRDLGLGAAAVAVVGAVFGLRRLDRGRKLFLAGVALLNLVAVVFVAGVDAISGFLTGIVAGGYILDLLVVVAVLVALGTAPVVDWVSAFTVDKTTAPRYRSSSAYDPGRFRSRVMIAMFVIVLLPSVLVHSHVANHRQPPLADRYAQRVFAELPPNAALFVFQADLTFPLVYRQSVLGERPDVRLVITTSLQFDWYRDQIARTLQLRTPVRAGDPQDQVQALINEIRPARPVFVDIGMMTIYRTRFPFRLRGLVGEVVARGESTAINRAALADELIRNDRRDGVAGHHHVYFPNGYVYFLYARAHIQLAKEYAEVNQIEPARTELARALDAFPDDETTRLVLKFSGQAGEKPEKIVEVIKAL